MNNETSPKVSKIWYLAVTLYLLSIVTYTVSYSHNVISETEKVLSNFPSWTISADSEWNFILKAISLPSDIMGWTLHLEVLISIIITLCIFLVVQYINHKNNSLSFKSMLVDLACFVWIYIAFALVVFFLSYMWFINL